MKTVFRMARLVLKSALLITCYNIHASYNAKLSDKFHFKKKYKM